MSQPYKYFAFISYSRKDSKVAAWLQKRLEWFRFPVKLVPEDRRPPKPPYIQPIYRDKTNLPVAEGHYWKDIKEALQQSRFLIVICSPNSAGSKPVNKEVRRFLATHNQDASLIVPMVLSGRPTSSGEDAALCPTLRSPRFNSLIHRNLCSLVPDGDEKERDAWEAGFAALGSYLLKVDRTAVGDHIQREERKRTLRFRLLTAAFALIAAFALAAGALAWIKERKIREESSRAFFLTGMEHLRNQDSTSALAYLARAVRTNPGNVAAATRLATLLGQRSWPVPLRSFTSEFPARELKFHPDGKRFLIASALDGYAEKGMLSLQTWDWTQGRMLMSPFNIPRNSVESLHLSARGDALALNRSHKTMFEHSNVFAMPNLSARTELPLNAVRSLETDEYSRVLALSEDGLASLAIEWNPDLGPEYIAIREVKSNGDTGSPLAIVMPGPQAGTKTLEDGSQVPATLPAGEVVFMPDLPSAKEVVAGHFDGSKALLLGKDGRLRLIDPATKKTESVLIGGKQRSSKILMAAFAFTRPWVAVLDSGGETMIWDWRGRVEVSSLFDTPQEKWALPTEALPVEPYVEHLSSEAAQLKFVFNDQALALVSHRASNGDYRPHAHGGIWQASSEEKGGPWSWTLLPEGADAIEDSLLLLREKAERLEVLQPGSSQRWCEPLTHESAVTAMTALNERLVATGTELGIVRVWARTPVPLTVSALDAPVVSQQALLTEREELEREAEVPRHLLASSRNGRSKLFGLGSLSGMQPLLLSEDHPVKLEVPLWDRIYDGNYIANAGRIAVCGGRGSAGSTPGSSAQGAYICDTQTGKTLSPLLVHDDCRWTGFSPDERWIVTVGNGYAQFWDSRDFKPSGMRLQHPGARWGAWHPRKSSMMFTVDARGAFRLWDLANGNMVGAANWNFGSEDDEFDSEDFEWLGSTDSIEFNDDGQWFVQRREGKFCLWDMGTLQPLIDTVTVSMDGRSLSYADALKRTGWNVLERRAWNQRSALLLAHLAEAVGGIAISDAGARVDIENRSTAFREVQTLWQQAAQSDPFVQLVGQILSVPEIHALVAQDDGQIASRLADGQIMHHLTEAARLANNSGLKELGEGIGSVFDRRRLLSMQLRFNEARRLSPEPAETAVKRLLEAWSKRDDPVGYMSAFQFGARDEGTLKKVDAFLKQAESHAKEWGNSMTDQQAEIKASRKELESSR